MKWEYKKINMEMESSSDTTSHLNLMNYMGEEGWELVGMERYYAKMSIFLFIFKRPLEEKDGDEKP